MGLLDLLTGNNNSEALSIRKSAQQLQSQYPNLKLDYPTEPVKPEVGKLFLQKMLLEINQQSQGEAARNTKVFDEQLKELSNEQAAHQKAQQQGEGLLNAAGDFAPGFEPALAQNRFAPDVRAQLLEQLQNSGGLTPEAQTQVKPGIAQLGASLATGQIKTPISDASYSKNILPNAPPTPKNALEDVNRKVSQTGVGSLTPGEKELWDHQQSIATARAQAYSAARPYAVIDTTENNTPKFVTGDELKKAQTAEPGRYAPPGPELKALNQNQFIADLRGSVALTKESLTNLKTEFTPEFRAKVAFALRSNDPHSAIDTLISSQFAKNLTPDQMQYVTDITQLHEQLLTMRSVLGAGQGSDELRAAIRATAPGAGTPTKEYGLVQLDKINKTIDRLAPYILKANPRKDMGGAAAPQAPAANETKIINGVTYEKRSDGKWYKP